MSLDQFTADAVVVGHSRKAIGSGVGSTVDLVAALTDHAEPAAAFLKALSHEGRLMILCHLAAGEKSVTELEGLIGQRQAAVSQQLARLRLEGLVSTRRDGKVIYYSLRDTRVVVLLACLPKLFKAAA